MEKNSERGVLEKEVGCDKMITYICANVCMYVHGH